MGKSPSWPNGSPRVKGRHTKANQKGGCGESVTFALALFVVLSLVVMFH